VSLGAHVAGDAVNIREIPAGARLQLEDGSTVQVVEPSKDGASLLVTYVESPFAPELLGTQLVCTDYEITGYAVGDGHTDTGSRLS